MQVTATIITLNFAFYFAVYVLIIIAGSYISAYSAASTVNIIAVTCISEALYANVPSQNPMPYDVGYYCIQNATYAYFLIMCLQSARRYAVVLLFYECWTIFCRLYNMAYSSPLTILICSLNDAYMSSSYKLYVDINEASGLNFFYKIFV